MRDAALKCAPFAGLPPALNALRALRAALPPAVVERLPRRPAAQPLLAEAPGEDVRALVARGRRLWRGVYGRHDEALLRRLGEAHPALPLAVVAGSYGLVLADPGGPHCRPTSPGEEAWWVGRVRTSLVAVACLRAQRGAGPQLVSHVYGLRNAFAEGGVEAGVEGWLGSDEGAEWVLGSVDRIVECFDGSGEKKA
jgi:hypothetical protein